MFYTAVPIIFLDAPFVLHRSVALTILDRTFNV
jgi:hypothetical protein